MCERERGEREERERGERGGSETARERMRERESGGGIVWYTTYIRQTTKSFNVHLL